MIEKLKSLKDKINGQKLAGALPVLPTPTPTPVAAAPKKRGRKPGQTKKITK